MLRQIWNNYNIKKFVHENPAATYYCINSKTAGYLLKLRKFNVVIDKPLRIEYNINVVGV